MTPRPFYAAAATLSAAIGALSAGCGGPAEDSTGHEVAEWVVKQGGTVHLVGRDIPVERLEQIPEGPIAVRGIDLTGSRVTSVDLERLTPLKHLESLTLYRTEVGDDGLATIAELEGLQTLELSYTRVTDAGLEPLAESKSLQKIYLRGTGVTEEAAEQLESRVEGLDVVTQ